MVKEINPIKEKELRDVSGSTGFNQVLIVKDYYITLILYLLKDVKGIYFKGGTALHKIFLNYSRLSEDVDYSLTRDVNEVKKLKNRWDEDMIPLLSEETAFQEVMKTLAKHFQYSEEKEKLKDTK